MTALYLGCGSAALSAYLNFNGKRGRGWRSKHTTDGGRHFKRAELRDEALLLIECEAMLWPHAVLSFLEHNAQGLAVMYADRDEREGWR